MPLPLTTSRGLQLARREEQPVKRRVAEKFRFLRPRRPRRAASVPRKFSFASPTHKPGSGVNQSSLRSHCVAGSRRGSSRISGLSAGPASCGSLRLPLVAVPKPDALVALAFRQQPQPHGFVEQFENELRRRRMRDAELLPIHAVVRLRPAQMHQQAMAQLAHRHGRLAAPRCSSTAGGGALRSR